MTKEQFKKIYELTDDEMSKIELILKMFLGKIIKIDKIKERNKNYD